MKKQILIGVLITFIAEIVALIVFAVHTPDFSQDTVAVNEVLNSVTRDFESLENHERHALDYVVLDGNGSVLYKTKPNLSESINAAISHRDTVLDIVSDGKTLGKLIVYNDSADELQAQKRAIVWVFTAVTAFQAAICLCYILYLKRTVIKPFSKLKGFAERVAGGNLDIPLDMDRHNLFGAFTESFDIMRSELKKARLAEAEAQKSKKELVAKLSHDIKTPVASIKAVAEVGSARSKSKKDSESFTEIIRKADQINTLVTNLFSATLEELTRLTVTPTDFSSTEIATLLSSSDYLKKAKIPHVPPCLIRADKLRLQQVFDNIFANSYKYAKTEILVDIAKQTEFLSVIIEDFGGGVPEEEIELIKEKFKRGANSANSEGAGLGLYISDYFLKEMGGELKVENGAHGLRVTVLIPLS